MEAWGRRSRLTSLFSGRWDFISRSVTLLQQSRILKAKRLSDHLLQRHAIYLQPINYPTVPMGTERLRITPGPLHTDTMIDDLVGAMVASFQALGLPLREAEYVAEAA